MKTNKRFNNLVVEDLKIKGGKKSVGYFALPAHNSFRSAFQSSSCRSATCGIQLYVRKAQHVSHNETTAGIPCTPSPNPTHKPATHKPAGSNWCWRMTMPGIDDMVIWACSACVTFSVVCARLEKKAVPKLKLWNTHSHLYSQPFVTFLVGEQTPSEDHSYAYGTHTILCSARSQLCSGFAKRQDTTTSNRVPRILWCCMQHLCGGIRKGCAVHTLSHVGAPKWALVSCHCLNANTWLCVCCVIVCAHTEAVEFIMMVKVVCARLLCVLSCADGEAKPLSRTTIMHACSQSLTINEKRERISLGHCSVIERNHRHKHARKTIDHSCPVRADVMRELRFTMWHLSWSHKNVRWLCVEWHVGIRNIMHVQYISMSARILKCGVLSNCWHRKQN